MYIEQDNLSPHPQCRPSQGSTATEIRADYRKGSENTILLRQSNYLHSSTLFITPLHTNSRAHKHTHTHFEINRWRVCVHSDPQPLFDLYHTVRPFPFDTLFFISGIGRHKESHHIYLGSRYMLKSLYTTSPTLYEKCTKT